MKPPAFTYHDPRTLGEALDLLGRLENARVLAGGQSLVPLLNFRLVRPDHLVDLNRVAGLDGIRVEDGTLTIGAMTRQRDVERSAAVRAHCPLLHEAIRLVGHMQTRNRGTIGGSLAHLDPAAELTAVAAATDAVLHAEGRQGGRRIPMERFAVGYLTSCLAPDEVLTAVSLSCWPPGAGHAFVEHARRHGDFAIVGVAALLDLAPAGSVRRAAIALTGVGPGPVRATAAERALAGQPASDEALRAAARLAVQALDPPADVHASRQYRLRLAEVLTRRALETARARATGSAGRG